MPALSVLAHHSEPSDPTLLRWIVDTFETVVGWGPAPVVILIGSIIVLAPVLLGFFAIRGRRRGAQDDQAGPDASASDRDGRLAR